MKRLMSFALFAVVLAAAVISCKKEPVVLTAPSISGVTPTTNSAEVTWNKVDQATNYILQLRPAGGEWSDAANATTTSATVSGLIPATEYEVRVKAKGGEGTEESPFSAAYMFTTLQEAPKDLAVPAITSVTPAAKSAEVAWNAVADAASYQLQLKAPGADWADAVSANASPATIEGLTPVTEYEVRVKAIAADGRVSEFSEPFKFTTTELVFSYPLTLSSVDEFVIWINEKAGLCEPTDVTTLGADIDLAGQTITSVPTFNGQFNGAGKSIKNLTTALFAELGETAVVENVVVDASSAINWTSPIEDMTGIAFIAGKSNGKIKNCSVAGSIKVNTDEAGRIYCAGIVGESPKGYVEGCKFTGSIDVELTKTSKSCSAIAGIVARPGHADMAGQVIVKDCVNEGNIKFVFSGPSKGMQKFGIGGVLGQTPSVANAPKEHGIVEGCTNKGNIEWQYPEGGSGSYPALGGVAGIIEGQLKNANNYGKITYKGGKAVAVTDASIGGVAGYVTGNTSDCHNFGTLDLDSAFAGGTSMAQSGGNTSFSTFGGVFGNTGPFAADATYTGDLGVTMENCTNEADFTITCYMIATGGPQMCFGGVVGASSSNMKNCHNKKNVTFKTQTKTMNAGGVVGYLEGNIEDCTNTGSVTLDGCSADHPTSISAQAYFGGVFGMIAKGATVNNVKNSGAITMQNVFNTPSAYSYLGGVNGSYKGTITMTGAENSGTVTLKSDNPICMGGVSGAINGLITNCKNSGKVHFATTYISDYTTATEDKLAEVGGLSGYANATFVNCSNTGDVVSDATGGFLSGLIGSFGQADATWNGLAVKCNVTGGAYRGSVLGRFRKPAAEGATYTITAEADVQGAAASLPGCGFDNGNNFILFSENLSAKTITYGDKTYPIVKLADGRWWMAAPLAYVPKGKTVSSDPKDDNGIWYTYTVEGGAAVPSVNNNDGYLYDYPTAMGKKAEELTFGTQSDWQSGNYRDFEGAQGICPPGWYIPTRADFLKLVGASNKDDTRGETAAVEDNTALYWVAACKGSSVKVFNEAGWNWSFLGARNKTSNTATGAYNVTVTDASKCNESAWIGKPALNQVMTSTAYKPNAAGTSFQYFALMSTFTSAYKDGRLSLSYAQYLQGVEVRCIRKAEEPK